MKPWFLFLENVSISWCSSICTEHVYTSASTTSTPGTACHGYAASGTDFSSYATDLGSTGATTAATTTTTNGVIGAATATACAGHGPHSKRHCVFARRSAQQHYSAAPTAYGKCLNKTSMTCKPCIALEGHNELILWLG